MKNKCEIKTFYHFEEVVVGGNGKGARKIE
jgi:hypothetical protein